MYSPAVTWGDRAQAANGAALPNVLLRAVDAGLCGVIFVAPYFFGGRHDLGRLVFVAIVAVMAVAWFLRQSLLPAALWPRTVAHLLLLLAIALVTLQIVPLPTSWLAAASPRTAQLLPLWTVGGGANLGTWQTISLAPHETTKALAMLISNALLFVVVCGRIGDHADVHRLLTWIGAAAALMAVFGLAQYATSDGRFFWFYDHPHRSTTQAFTGPFINRNHFANFLVMGGGPLVYWLSFALRKPATAHHSPVPLDVKRLIVTLSVTAAVAVVVACILLTRSLGGAAALFVSGAVITLLLATRGLLSSLFIYGIIGLAVLVGGIMALHGGENAFSRLDVIADGSFENLDHDGIRQKLWAANIAAFQSGWLSGAGIGSHRDFCQVYLPQYFTKEYTHAENGYLQIASEAGVGGIAILFAAIALVTAWCIGAWRRARNAEDVGLLAVIAAGLAATVAHSVVDFVWYIPACMTVVIIFAACALRLAQLSTCAVGEAPREFVLRRNRWFELTAAAALVGGWSVVTFVGPGIAAVHWDRYVLASVAKSQTQRQSPRLAGRASLAMDGAARNELMLRELEHVVNWDPQFARAHLKLAVRYIAKFDQEQQNAENAITLTSLRDAVNRSGFESQAAIDDWLQRAVGANLQYLRRAEIEARKAVALCPLQGEAYICLARLAFLDGEHPDCVREFTNQALLVRPNSAEVLFEIGREELAANNLDTALECWQKCFDDSGPHQQKIIELLAGQIPASKLLATLQPDWPLLRNVWNRYRESGRVEDLDALLSYSLKATRNASRPGVGVPPAFAWYFQSQLFTDVGQSNAALACLEEAYRYDGRQYPIRHALAKQLHNAGSLTDAEPHYRWCLARRPSDKSLSAALVAIAKARQAERGNVARARPASAATGVSLSSSNSSSNSSSVTR